MNVKLEAKSPPEVINALCPICPGESVSNYVHKMQDSSSKDISYWNQCRCGVVWQHRYPDEVKKYYDKEYIKVLLEDKVKYSDSCYYYSRVYAQIIEELMYGRKLLDVGYMSPYNMQAFSIRGWVPFGIEVNPDASESNRLIKGDFENYEFPDRMKYDLIWMNHVIENMKDPVAALKRTFDLLTPNGTVFIATPDTDILYVNSSGSFKYWAEHENYIMWNKDSLSKKLEEIGFEIIVSRRNTDVRFTYTNDLHLIAQKKFF